MVLLQCNYENKLQRQLQMRSRTSHAAHKLVTENLIPPVVLPTTLYIMTLLSIHGAYR